VDQGKRSVATRLEKRRASAGRGTKTGESLETARSRQRLLLDHGYLTKTWLIIRHLPDRGFKSHPRNQFSALTGTFLIKNAHEAFRSSSNIAFGTLSHRAAWPIFSNILTLK